MSVGTKDEKAGSVRARSSFGLLAAAAKGWRYLRLCKDRRVPPAAVSSLYIHFCA
jgi:hypothetical protein